MTAEEYLGNIFKRESAIKRRGVCNFKPKSLDGDMTFESKMYGFHKEMTNQRATMKWNS